MPPPPEDPFPLVQQEVQNAWLSLSSNLSHLTPANLQARLESLECDVQDLSSAVQVARQDRTRFNLTEHELISRENFLVDMRRNLTSLRQTTAAQQRRAALHSGASFPSPIDAEKKNDNAPADQFIADELRHQELIMEQQDGDLDDLAIAVERIGVMGRDMHQELAEQGQLLDHLGQEFDDTRSRMATVHQKLDKFIAETGPRQFCTIVGLFLTFIVLTFLLVVT